MTEAEWHTSRDPEAMLKAARDVFRLDLPHSLRTKRKRRLFAAACCRLVWPQVAATDCCRQAVEYLETHFAPYQPGSEYDLLRREVKQAAENPPDGTPRPQVWAAYLVSDAEDPAAVIGHSLGILSGWVDPETRLTMVADILRCIAGNPFRPAAFDPAWRTSAVLALARGIHDDRAFDRLPILADALQEAGCDDDELLAHCRGPGPHVRGCWAVDRCLGLE